MRRRIFLIRHGKSACVLKGPIQRREVQDWLIAYDQAGLAPESSPSSSLVAMAADCKVWCSDLPRSMESARALKSTFSIDPIFREHELPVAPVPLIKLPVGAWDVIGKAFCLCGYAPKTEPFKKAKARARTAAQKLVDETTLSPSVLLMGHGFFNLLIGRELGRLGFQCETDKPFDHWGRRAYSRNW